MRKTNKKGFTIVELVIVIAVVAILAAVLIPTFVSVTNKAKQSADIQACRQMNTYLAVNEVTDGKTIKEVYNTLEEGGMSAENYKPLSKDTYYFWDKDLNRVLYTDKDYKVTFPEEYKNVTKNDHQWYSLSGKISTEKIEKNGDDYTIDKAEQLMYLSEQKLSGTVNIILPAKIDLMGGQLRFNTDGTANITIKPATGTAETEIKGFVNSENSKQGVKGYDDNKKKDVGLVPFIENGSVTIENITIDGASVGANDVGSSSFLVGEAINSTITINNVLIKNSKLYGMNKVGTFVGNVSQGSTVSVVDSTIENVEIHCAEGEAGIYFGGVWARENTNNLNITNVKYTDVNLVLDEQDGRNYVKDFTWEEGTPNAIKGVTVLCERMENNKLSGKYRGFCNNALFMFVQKYKLNGGAEVSLDTSNDETIYAKAGETGYVFAGSACWGVVTSI